MEENNNKEVHTQESTMSKAAQLAMELSKEKARLKEELTALQAENEELTPTTPTGTADWYAKWFSVVMSVAGIFLINAGLIQTGQAFYVVSGIAWIYVGMVWADRAIMIGSAITTTAMALTLAESLLP